MREGTVRLKLKSLLAEKGAMDTADVIKEMQLKYPELKRHIIRGRLSEMKNKSKEIDLVDGKFQLVFAR